MKTLTFVRITLCLLILLGAGFISPKPGKEKPKPAAIQWLTLEEAAALNKKAPRKIFVDVYTDWCGWCKKMDQSTFTDPAVVAYVNKKYYAVKLNAEGQEPITVNGKTYAFDAKYRAHAAAMALLNGKMSYPTTVFLDEQMGIITPVPGYLEAKTFRTILTYFGENHYKQQSYADFTASAKTK